MKLSKSMKAKEGDFTPTNQIVYTSCSLPLWDEATIGQENWGCALFGAHNGNTGKAAKNAGKDALAPADFVDTDGNKMLEGFIKANYCTAKKDQADGSAAVTGPQKEPFSVSWQKPSEFLKPFRPVVHRNMTPYLDPYAPDAAQHALRSKKEAAQLSEAPPVTASSRKGGDAAPTGETDFFEQHAEVVNFLDEMTPQDAESWRHATPHDIVRRYRELPTLMEPYDPTLTVGCAETPAEAVGSRYSTALRHKLQRAEALSTLSAVPPFLMSAFNSVMLAVEQLNSHIETGNYLWELIYPHAPGTSHPVYNPAGKYVVKLYVKGVWCRVVVDDLLPVDELGRPLLTITSARELWPALLAKAVIKVMKTENVPTLFDSPETMVSLFLGNWIPQYFNFHPRESVDSTKMLLSYMKQLEDERQKQRGPPTPEKIAAADEPPKETAAAEDAEKVGAEAPPQREEKILVGALRDSKDTSVFPGCGSGTQLYTVVDVAPFRNTLAVHLVTTPKTGLTEGTFQLEKDAEDVQQILKRPGARPPAVPTEKDGSLVSVWLTMEELGERMDALVVWHSFDIIYAKHVTIKYDAAASNVAEAAPAAAKKTNAAGPKETKGGGGETGFASGQETKSRTLWWTVQNEADEEITIVVYGRCQEPVAPDSTQRQGSSSKTRGSASTAAAGASSSKSVTPKRAPSNSKLDDGDLLLPPPPVPDTNELILDYYRWDRAEPFTHVHTILYEQEKCCCAKMCLTPGQHTFRITVPRMNPRDHIAILGNCTMELRNELGDSSSTNPLHELTDADYYSAFDATHADQVWLKRKFKVTEAIRLTAILNALPDNEDPAALRDSGAAAAAAGKLTKTTTTIVPVLKGAGHKQSGATAADLFPNALTVEHDEQAVLRLVKMTLVDLDTSTTVCEGDLGRITQVQLPPNTKGYLLMAYMGNGSSGSATAGRDARGGSAAHASSQNGPRHVQELSQHRKIVMPKGVWKLTIRSDKELTGYENINPVASAIKDAGYLSRGGTCVLFSHAFSLPEAAHLSLFCDVRGEEPVPFIVAISRTTSSTSAALSPSSCLAKKQPSDVVYTSGPRLQHLFVPDIFLEAGEKTKGAGFLIEGFIPEDRARELEEKCRQEQERRFLLSRKDAEEAMQRLREQEIEAYKADPEGYGLRKREAQQHEQRKDVGDASVRNCSVSAVQPKMSVKGRVSSGHQKGSVSIRPSAGLTLPCSPSLSQIEERVENMQLQYTLQVTFSAPKVDQRNTQVAEDPLTSMRVQWKELLGELSEMRLSSAPKENSPTAKGRPSTGSANAPTKMSKQQQAAAAAEEQLRGEQARQSRQRFLDNPRNVLLPYESTPVEEPAGNERTRTTTGTKRQASIVPLPPPTVVTEDPVDGDQRHAPLLPPESYQVHLLPLRAFEQVPPTAGVSSPTKPGSSLGGRDTKKSKAAPKQPTLASRSLSTCAGGILDESVPDTVREEEVEHTRQLQNTLKKQSDLLQSEATQERDKHRFHTFAFKAELKEFWVQRLAALRRENADGLTISAEVSKTEPAEPNVVDGVPEVVFSSLVGAADDDAHPKRQKSVVHL